MSQQDIQNVYNNVKKIFVDKSVDTANIVNLTVHTMQLVEVIPHLTGGDKKNIVIEVIKLLISDSPLDDNTKAALDLIVQTTLPILIDTIISASSGDFNFNTIKACFAKWKCCQ